MGNKGRWEYLQAIYERYRKAERKAKKVILSEFCANTGYHRKYAIRLLNGPRPGKQPRARERRRRLSYGAETLAILTAVWGAAAQTELWCGDAGDSDGRVGSGGLPVVGTAEGAVAVVAALDPQTL